MYYVNCQCRWLIGYLDQAPHTARYGAPGFVPSGVHPAMSAGRVGNPGPGTMMLQSSMQAQHIPPYARAPYGPMDEPSGPRMGVSGYSGTMPAHSLPPAAIMQLSPELLQSQMAG